MNIPIFKNITAIIQARVGSTRLPNKIFKEICNKPILWHVINRVKNAKLINNIVVATTILKEDDLTEEFCNNNAIKCFRGSSEDVLSRYYEAAKKFNADLIVRITSDCPFIDPVIIDNMLVEFINHFEKEKIDYLSNTIVRTFPRGLDVEVFPFPILEKVHYEAKKDFEREHVTPYIYLNPDMFNMKNYKNDVDYSNYRWTVDTIEDYNLVKIVYNCLFKEDEIFLLEDILRLFKERPELNEINKDIKQKSLYEK